MISRHTPGSENDIELREINQSNRHEHICPSLDLTLDISVSSNLISPPTQIGVSALAKRIHPVPT